MASDMHTSAVKTNMIRPLEVLFQTDEGRDVIKKAQITILERPTDNKLKKMFLEALGIPIIL